MNRNTESRFALNPSVSIGRSTFKRPSSVKTTFNTGAIIPFYLDEVLPGDTFKIKTSKVCRMQPMVTAPMDNLYLDTYYFFVPMRLVWSHSKEFFGECSTSPWRDSVSYTLPQVTSPSGGWSKGTIADYFGIPIGVDNLSINALPFRAYALIMDQWFKSTVVDYPLNIPVDDSTIAGSNGGTFITDVVKGGQPYVANKYFDMFTGCLPEPQRGPDTLIPIAASTTTEVPVFGNGKALGVTDGSSNLAGLQSKTDSNSPYYVTATKQLYGSNTGVVGPTNPSFSNTSIGLVTKTEAGSNPENSGLIADVSALGINVGSINQLRMAFQIQKWYEKLARGGDRYIELVKSMFAVTSPDARLQRAEYLGGNRCPINVNVVTQTGATGSGSTPQGTITGQSITVDVHKDFTRSFTEHGYVIGVMCARYDHTYQQGLERLWTRLDKFDFYWPVFANLGDQKIRNDQIYAQGSSAVNPVTGKAYDEEVFGYQEAWAEYRYKPSMTTGEMRSTYTTPLDKWHFGDVYNALPSLSDPWLREDPTNVDRCLTVAHTTADQFYADIYIDNLSTRPMPMYSIPGLIDHN